MAKSDKKPESTTALAPIDKKRRQALEAMRPELRTVAVELDRKIGLAATGLVLVRYRIGEMIAEVIEKEATYGSKAVEQLAAYRGEKPQTLYALRDFAVSFQSEFVSEWTNKPMADGSYLTEKHWMAVRKLSNQSDREKYLTMALKQSLSANDLELEIKSSGSATKTVRGSGAGRHASAPTSPLAGLQKFGSLALSLYNYEEQQMEKSVFGAIDEMAPDNVNEILLERLKSTKTTVVNAKNRLESAEERIEKNIDRVEEILEEKAKKAKENPEVNGEAASEKTKSKKTKSKKAKSKKKKRPAATTV